MNQGVSIGGGAVRDPFKVILALLLGGAPLGHAEGALDERSKEDRQNDQKAAEFTATDAGFAVAFPGTPTRRENMIETPDGPSRSITYEAKQDGCGYLAQRVAFPAGTAAAGAEWMLDKQRASLRTKNEQAGGAVLSETAVTLGSSPGIEVFQAPALDSTARSRSFAVGRE